MPEAIFLSAGVPDPARGPEFAETADVVAIGSAVSALMHVTLGRRPLIWGGHPAITPMIWVVAKDFGVDYSNWVTLYQSSFFEDRYPEDNERFKNVIYTDKQQEMASSLNEMRQRMFTENNFFAAVFIGGMKGILDEYAMFHELNPSADIIPVASTGGASLTLANNIKTIDDDLTCDLDYVSLFHRHLHISARERRYPRLTDQPAKIEERLINGPNKGWISSA